MVTGQPQPQPWTGQEQRCGGQFPLLQFSAHQSSIPGRWEESWVATHLPGLPSLLSRLSILLRRAVRLPLIPVRDWTTSPDRDSMASSSWAVLV